jgi:hypothetical protein
MSDLASAVRGLAKFVKLLLKLVKQERSHLNLVGSGHRKAYRTPELASNSPGGALGIRSSKHSKFDISNGGLPSLLVGRFKRHSLRDCTRKFIQFSIKKLL